MSQQAAATLGAPAEEGQVRNRRLSSYPAIHRYRTLDNNDGSYLLLLDPAQPAGVRDATRQAGVGSQ
jgi:sigma-E factor negative regulatory protein RseA